MTQNPSIHRLQLLHDSLKSCCVLHSVERAVHLLRLLPGEVRVASTEVAESSSLLINGSLEIELLDDGAGSEAEVFLDDAHKVVISQALLDSAVCVDSN